MSQSEIALKELEDLTRKIGALEDHLADLKLTFEGPARLRLTLLDTLIDYRYHIHKAIAYLEGLD